MLHADTINEAAHGCLSEHKDIMELDNVDWEKLFKQNNSFALEVAQPWLLFQWLKLQHRQILDF